MCVCVYIYIYIYIHTHTHTHFGRDSSVGIATRYGLHGPRIEFRCGRDFPPPVQTGPGAHPVSYTMGTGCFPGVKRPGRGVDHPPTSSAKVKERVGLYLCSPFVLSWPVLGWALPLPFYIQWCPNPRRLVAHATTVSAVAPSCLFYSVSSQNACLISHAPRRERHTTVRLRAHNRIVGRGQLKCDSTRAETRFRLYLFCGGRRT